MNIKNNKKQYIIIFAIIWYAMFFMHNKLHKLPIYKKNYNKYLDYYFDSKDIAFNKSINFIKNCLSSEIIKHLTFDNITKPKISVVVPLFNCEKFILRAIKSIQSQNISNFEIILIDDNSKDNTINLVEKIKSEDNRIKILKNQKNKGILYSRSIGVLSSKGKYLFTLDNDDIFLNNDIFYSITNIAENENFDIVEFKAISNKELNQDILNKKIEDSLYSHPKSFALFQPELGRYPIKIGNKIGNFGFKDIFLWGKCIRTKIYKAVLIKLGYRRYSRFMIRCEDIIMNYMICNTAESFIFVEKYGIYHILRKGSGADIGQKKVSRPNNILYLIDIVIDFSRNDLYNKKLSAYIMIYFLKLQGIRNTLTQTINNKELFISCLKRILSSSLISDIYKLKIRDIVRNLEYINHNNYKRRLLNFMNTTFYK